MVSKDVPQQTDEYLAAVTIGARVPLNGTVYLASYDPAWPSKFLLLAGRIRDALAEKILLLEHVGSTSVPGISAKPVIDMVLAVSNSARRSSLRAAARRAGVRAKGP
jgi:GrpB-like predicted nucleotidyltransferase (UPF0157 family)